MRQAQVVILNAANDVSRTGAKFDVNQAVSASFTIVNGDVAAAGSVKIQCSNELIGNGDRFQFTPSASSWVDIPNATATVTAGIAPAIVIPNMCFSYIRAVFTQTGAGSTTIVVTMNYLSVA